MAPKLECAKTPFDKEKKKMCQISLNTYSHNEPYDLHAQVIFQKKKKLMMTTHFQSHIHFFRRQALLLRFETLPFEYYRQKCEFSFCQI